MKIRGAPAIATLAALAFASVLSKDLAAGSRPHYLSSVPLLKEHLKQILDYIYTARPTAVNLGQATRRLHSFIDARADSDDVATAVKEIIEEARNVAREDVGRNKAMAKLGGDWVLSQSGDEKVNVMTVCNTGSLATSVSAFCEYW